MSVQFAAELTWQVGSSTSSQALGFLLAVLLWAQLCGAECWVLDFQFTSDDALSPVTT